MRPSETTSRPVSSSPRNSTSSIRSRVCVDLLSGLLDELVDVGARQRGGLEQHEQARERRPQLVRDGGGEAGAELLVGRELRQGREEEHERRAAPARGRPRRSGGRARRRRAGAPRPGWPPRAGARRRGPRPAPPAIPPAPGRVPPPRLPPLHHSFTLRHPVGIRRNSIMTPCPRCSSSRTTRSSPRGWRATSAPPASTPPGSGTATRGSRGSATRSPTPACSISCSRGWTAGS